MKWNLLGLIIVGQFFMIGCGEDSTESVILGTWLATDMVREGCDEPLNNGALNCEYRPELCESCMKFILSRDGSYTLTADFNTGINNETGDYETKNGAITLDPANGEPYDLLISDVTDTNMVTELPLANGCIAVVTLKKTDC